MFDDEQFEGRLCKNSEVPNAARDGDVAAYHDSSPIHLCSIDSLDDLNTRLENPMKIYSFRPNIIVMEVDKPYAEVRSSLIELYLIIIFYRIVGVKSKLVKSNSHGFPLLQGDFSIVPILI